MKIVRMVIVSMVLLAGGCASTATHWKPAPVESFAKPLGLQEAVAMAQRQDLRSGEWKARYTAATAAVTKAWIPPNPTANFGWEDIGLKDVSGKSLMAPSIGVSYPVLFWITRPWEIASARHRKTAEEQTVLAEKRNLAADVGHRWFELAALSRKVKLCGEAVNEAEEGLRYARAGVEAGSASTLDASRAEVELLRSKADAADAETSRRSAQLAFAFSLGADHPAYPEVEDVITKDLEPVPEAMKNRRKAELAEVTAAMESAKAAHDDLAVQYAGIVPLTDVQASASRKNGPDGMSDAYSVDIPIPLFDWNSAGIAQAKAQRTLSEIAAERARRDASQLEASAWDQWAAARSKYEQFIMPIHEKSAALNEAGNTLFSEGEIGYPEYLQLQRDTTATSLSAVDAWLDARSSEWTLLCLLGTMPAGEADAHPDR